MTTAPACSAARPSRGTRTAAATVAPAAMPKASGVSVRPAWMAEKCSPNCRNRVSESMVPIMPAKNATIAARPALNDRWRNTLLTISGSRPRRVWPRLRSTSRTNATPLAAIIR